jgi:CelD/BcsL family acetyltransferase involved in cellulose biosynthesis
MPHSSSFSALPHYDVLASRWRALEADGQGSFFLGWTWIGSWLKSTSADPELLSITDETGQDRALALFSLTQDRRRLGTVPTLHLNEAGDKDKDRPFIEYNGLLLARDAGVAVVDAALDALFARKDWRALKLSGLEPRDPLARDPRARRHIQRDHTPAYFVDLHSVRDANGEYLFLLSSNTRSQIRRSFKDHGDPQVEQAQLPSQIDDWLADMERLNRGRHEDNAWEHVGFRRFVQTICHAGLGNGEVELLRITTGGALTGYLVNFVYRGRAMNYQSAFVEPKTSKSKPGMMCHSAAVERYACRSDLQIYSFLAGSDRYKQSLSTGSEELEWWTLERFSWALDAEALARRILGR